MHLTSALREKHILIPGRWLYNGQQSTVRLLAIRPRSKTGRTPPNRGPCPSNVRTGACYVAFNFRTNINAVSCMFQENFFISEKSLTLN